MIKVLLVDDHDLVRAGIKSLLEKSGDIKVIAEAASGTEALYAFPALHPDVVILDISMPVMDGLEACKQLKKMDPTVKILILTVYPEKEYATRVLTSGALGYVTKKASPEELHRAVRSVADNTIYISQDSKDIILSKLLNLKGNPDFLDTLSDREMQVLRLLGQGKGIKDIASELCLSPKTIDNYRYRILNKLDLKRTVDLVLFANQHKLT